MSRQRIEAVDATAVDVPIDVVKALGAGAQPLIVVTRWLRHLTAAPS